MRLRGGSISIKVVLINPTHEIARRLLGESLPVVSTAHIGILGSDVFSVVILLALTGLDLFHDIRGDAVRIPLTPESVPIWVGNEPAVRNEHPDELLRGGIGATNLASQIPLRGDTEPLLRVRLLALFRRPNDQHPDESQERFGDALVLIQVGMPDGEVFRPSHCGYRAS